MSKQTTCISRLPYNSIVFARDLMKRLGDCPAYFKADVFLQGFTAFHQDHDLESPLNMADLSCVTTMILLNVQTHDDRAPILRFLAYVLRLTNCKFFNVREGKGTVSELVELADRLLSQKEFQWATANNFDDKPETQCVFINDYGIYTGHYDEGGNAFTDELIMSLEEYHSMMDSIVNWFPTVDFGIAEHDH